VKSYDPGLQFILTRIERGMTLTDCALMAYQRGELERGDSARAQATKALDTAKRFLVNLDDIGYKAARTGVCRLERALVTLAEALNSDSCLSS
jgi:hypothetical protein